MSDLKANFSLLFSAIALVVSAWQADVNQRQHDLSTGKARAALAVVGRRPATVFPRDIMDFRGPGESVRFESVDRLLANNPTIVLKNSGTSSIDAVRVEIALIKGAIIEETVGLADHHGDMDHPTPWILGPEVIEYPPSGKIEPGHEMEISLVRGLICQILRAQVEDRPDHLHLGLFRIRCFARTTGATAFDWAEEEATVTLKFAWSPNGFPRDRCEELVEAIVPYIEVY